MPRWTQSDLDAYENRRLPPRAKPEQIVCHEPVAETAGKTENPGRIHVRITSWRCRLCDPDNLSPKYFIDCLRYAEIIPDDREQDIELTVRQVKVKTKSEQRTEIEII